MVQKCQSQNKPKNASHQVLRRGGHLHLPRVLGEHPEVDLQRRGEGERVNKLGRVGSSWFTLVVQLCLALFQLVVQLCLALFQPQEPTGPGGSRLPAANGPGRPGAVKRP